MTNYEALLTSSYRQVKECVIEHVEDELGTDSYTMDITKARINQMSKYEILDAYLKEEGIIGYTAKIIDLFLALDKADSIETGLKYHDTDSVYKITLKEGEKQ